MNDLLATRLSPENVSKVGYGKYFQWKDYSSWYCNKLSTEQRVRFDRLINSEPSLIHDSNLSSVFNFSIIAGYFNNSENRDIYRLMIDEVFRLFSLWFSVDYDLFISDSYYAAWFFGAENNIAKVVNDFSSNKYAEFRAVDDNLCPRDCVELSRKIYKVDSQSFIDTFDKHWIVPRYGCRCSVSVFGENLVVRKVNEGNTLMNEIIPRTINNEPINYAEVVYGLIDQPYDFGRTYCRLVELMPRDNDYYKKIEQLRMIEIFRESVDIVISTKNIETAQSRIDVAKIMLSGFDWQYIINVDELNKIKDRVESLFKDAHTATYINIHKAHLEKAKQVKRQATKDKYIQLAMDCLEGALKDKYTHKIEIQKLILEFKSKIEYKD